MMVFNMVDFPRPVPRADESHDLCPLHMEGDIFDERLAVVAHSPGLLFPDVPYSRRLSVDRRSMRWVRRIPP